MSINEILVLIVSTIGGIYDLKSRRIPNWLTLGTFIIALLYNLLFLQFSGALNCTLGFLVGILILIIPYAMGGMGAGDVKLLGAVGAIVGFKDVISIFLYSAICGLCLGLIWIIFKPGHLKFLITTGQIFPTIDKKEKVPYGVAILLGTILYIVLDNQFIRF